MTIRLEEPKDYRIVENLTREAFWNKYQPGCDEHFILHQFRTDPAFIPELDLLIEEEQKIIAHIMYCRIHIQCDDERIVPAILFGPVSVLPEYQAKGYGSKLIRYSLEKATQLGYGSVCITGNPQFYHCFGFRSSSCFGVYLQGVPRSEEAPFSMALELQPDYFKDVKGTIVLPKLYECDPDECAAFDRTFPLKEKVRRADQLR